MKWNATDGENFTDLDNNEPEQKQLYLPVQPMSVSSPCIQFISILPRGEREECVPTPDGGMLLVRQP